MNISTPYTRTRTYRFTSKQVNELKTTSRLLGCTESALVRKLINQGIVELRDQLSGR